MTASIIEMVKDLTLSQIYSGGLGPDELTTCLRNTYRTLRQCHAAESATAITAAPKMDWRTSISRNRIECLECGALLKSIGTRHLTKHNMASAAYRAKYGIPKDQSLSSRESTKRRQASMHRIRPWEKRVRPYTPKVSAKKVRAR